MAPPRRSCIADAPHTATHTGQARACDPHFAAVARVRSQKQQKMGAKDRLAYLMKQTDIFAHFIKSETGAGSSSAAESGGKSGRKGKGRMSEKQEDEMLLKQTENKAAEGTRLTVQPKARRRTTHSPCPPARAASHRAALCPAAPPPPPSPLSASRRRRA